MKKSLRAFDGEFAATGWKRRRNFRSINADAAGGETAARRLRLVLDAGVSVLRRGERSVLRRRFREVLRDVSRLRRSVLRDREGVRIDGRSKLKV